MEDIIQVDDAKVQRIVRKIILKENKNNKTREKNRCRNGTRNKENYFS